ncbi:hypothetical protein PHISCL_11062 [Aspergillus sclerotialis]|uniref:Uncharacterized protein n=1 Tax=Aspergillus sclerotialis TaxID=2070753 RepID=A0A3A2ZH64_9EURO|nr:hypothetical protein PHISCL_11062 [Aspergillus sclerotialis]
MDLQRQLLARECVVGEAVGVGGCEGRDESEAFWFLEGEFGLEGAEREGW